MSVRPAFSIALISVLGLSLTACSSVSDRYAFWRESDAPVSTAAEPNLGNVPTPPQLQDTNAQLEQIRQRLEQDRQNAYGAVTHTVMPTQLQQPYYPSQAAPVNPYATATPAQANPPVQTNIIDSAIQQSELDAAYPSQAFPSANQPWAQPNENGNTTYRYGNNQDTVYVYGQSPVNIRTRQPDYGMAQPMPSYVTNDPSVSIDWAALDNGTIPANEYAMSPVSPASMNGEPLVYFGHGSARLNTNDRTTLRRVAKQLKSTPQSVVVVGYASQRTDISSAVASRKINLDMSARRSMGVVMALNKMGVSIDQIRTAAMGDTFATGNESKDRRVDIVFGQ